MLGSDVAAILRAAIDRGYSLVPVNEDKRPRIPTWKPYQSRLPTQEELTRWWNEEPPAWAVVTGAISKLIILDFDGASGMQILQKLNRSPHVVTGSGGAHLYIRHPGWRVPTVNGRSKQELGHRYLGLDIRGDSGYAVIAGRNRNGVYEWVRAMEPDPLEVLPLDLREFLGLLHPPVSDSLLKPILAPATGRIRVDAERLIQHALELVQSGRGRNDAGFLLALQLRDNGFDESAAAAVMREYASRVPANSIKRSCNPYTVSEAMHSLQQAYSRSPRQPWGTSCTVSAA